MLDITNLTANPIPAAISDLQEANISLQEKNNRLGQVLFGVLIVGSLIGIYYYINNSSKNEDREIK
jgi:hypothetical protein